MLHAGHLAPEPSFAFHRTQQKGQAFVSQQSPHHFHAAQQAALSDQGTAHENLRAGASDQADEQATVQEQQALSQQATPQQLADHLAQLKQEFKDICSTVFDDQPNLSQVLQHTQASMLQQVSDSNSSPHNSDCTHHTAPQQNAMVCFFVYKLQHLLRMIGSYIICCAYWLLLHLCLTAIVSGTICTSNQGVSVEVTMSLAACSLCLHDQQGQPLHDVSNCLRHQSLSTITKSPNSHESQTRRATAYSASAPRTPAVAAAYGSSDAESECCIVPCQATGWPQLDLDTHVPMVHAQCHGQHTQLQLKASQDAQQPHGLPRVQQVCQPPQAKQEPQQAQSPACWAENCCETASDAGTVPPQQTPTSFWQQQADSRDQGGLCSPSDSPGHAPQPSSSIQQQFIHHGSQGPTSWRSETEQQLFSGFDQQESMPTAARQKPTISKHFSEQPAHLAAHEQDFAAFKAVEHAQCCWDDLGKRSANLGNVEQELADLRTNNEALVGMVERERQRVLQLADRLQQAEASALEVCVHEYLIF